MRKIWWFIAPLLGLSIWANAQETTPARQRQEVESVYAPPEPPRENEGANDGGVNFSFDYAYMTDYVWRGIDRSESGGSEDSPNMHFDGKLSFNTGKYPHPFVGLFANLYDSDPRSRFQEIRPYFGFDWNLRPFLFSIGHSSYIFPDRDAFNTSEIFAKCTLDDSYFFRSDKPLLAPYVFVAYDYDTGHGVYFELGISHDIRIEDTGITITPQAHIAYVNSNHIFATPGGVVSDPAFAFSKTSDDTGFQHYQVGIVATYGLNELFNIPRRWGQFDLKGYIFYANGIDNKLRADTGIWGGMGLSFSY